MATRGAYGFVKNNEYKVAYNHFDSYLEGLGTSMVDYVSNNTIEDMNKDFDNIILVKQEDYPDPKQLEEINNFLSENGLENRIKPENFGSGTKDWYYLLNGTQGKPELFKNGLRYMTDDKEFINDTLFCEFGYLVDLDNNHLIIKSDDKECKYDFDNIPINWIERTYDKLNNPCKRKYLDLVWDKSDQQQESIFDSIEVLKYIKSPLKAQDYYAQEKVYHEIIENIKENDFESLLDNYMEQDYEMA